MCHVQCYTSILLCTLQAGVQHCKLHAESSTICIF